MRFWQKCSDDSVVRRRENDMNPCRPLTRFKLNGRHPKMCLLEAGEGHLQRTSVFRKAYVQQKMTQVSRQELSHKIVTFVEEDSSSSADINKTSWPWSPEIIDFFDISVGSCLNLVLRKAFSLLFTHNALRKLLLKFGVVLPWKER